MLDWAPSFSKCCQCDFSGMFAASQVGAARRINVSAVFGCQVRSSVGLKDFHHLGQAGRCHVALYRVQVNLAQSARS